MADSDDDTPQLSSNALAALQEFLSEQQAAQELMAGGAQENADAPMVEEDWVGKII